eukprot:scaffold64076_cov55-Attheya_sp.AAC.2
MAVQHKRRLQQGDCKNAFCQATLSDDKPTIIRPPVGCPLTKAVMFWRLKKSLYRLRHAPCHWFDKIKGILKSMGLRTSPHDPCIFHGSLLPGSAPIYIGLYVDDFCYFSSNPKIESLFEKLLASMCSVNFMGDVSWFLGVSFDWSKSPTGDISVHLNQAAFSQFLVDKHNLTTANKSRRATPYQYGVPVDGVPDIDMPPEARKSLQKKYRSGIGMLTNWLATCTRLDLAPINSFLAAYQNHPSPGHMDAALYIIRYINSTVSHGIRFCSSGQTYCQGYVHHPFSHDTATYDDVIRPLPDQIKELFSYSDACWGP